MLRCYIRLLPDTPFLLFYNENNLNYWMIQSFDGANSSTITISDYLDPAKSSIPREDLAKHLANLPLSLEKEKVKCTSASVLMSTSSIHSIHSQLCKTIQESFVMLLSSYPISSALSPENALSIPLTSSSDILIRYSPKPYQTLYLDADLLFEQYSILCTNQQSQCYWKSLSSPDVLEAIPPSQVGYLPFTLP